MSFNQIRILSHPLPQFYRATKLAEANQLKLTKEYLELVKYQSIATNAKLYFGPSIPAVFSGFNEQQIGADPQHEA